MNTTKVQAGPTSLPIGFQLRKLDGLLNERFEGTLGARGVSRRQWQLLRMLAEQAHTLVELNEAVAPFLDRAEGETARRHLDPLAAGGVVTVTDGVYKLTADGRAFVDGLVDEVQLTRDLTVRGFEEGEYDRTVASLQRMIRNLEE
ncbi:MAG TPA: MarR family transcriptional regulator [Pseudolysinimonas sp.]|nr:MarR family transcriptional regulator [Pseudolysinimonas sp.]